MAEIDKSLPNVKQTINVPSPEEVAVEYKKSKKNKTHQLIYNQMKMVVLI